MITNLDAQYWKQRYQDDATQWDIGEPSPALIRYFERLPSKQLRILIPGAGRAYEAQWLYQKGFTEVYVCDWADEAFDHLRQHCPDFPEAHLIVDDFFHLSGPYDRIVEQTFFCALPPARRTDYVTQCANLLRPGGRLAGLLFAHPFPFEGPPFGAEEATYRSLFEPELQILEMAISPHSIAPRLGNELFFECEKASTSDA